jgi:hypothetical protein
MAQSLKAVNVVTLFVEDPLRSKEFYEGILIGSRAATLGVKPLLVASE